MARMNWKIRDNSDEYAIVNFPVAEPAAGGADYDDIAGNTLGDSYFDLNAAVALVTLGNIAAATFNAVEYSHVDSRPASKWAQRELGARVFFHDDTNGKKYHRTIPAVDIDNVFPSGSEEGDLTPVTGNVALLALKAAMETHCVTEDGNGVVVDRVILVSRNS